jgi:nucleoside permease NupC
MQQQSVGAHCTTPVMMMMMPAQQTSTTTSQPHSHADTSPVAPVMMNNNIGNMMGVPMAMCTFAQPMTYVAMIAIPNAFSNAVAANIVPTSAATPP